MSAWLTVAVSGLASGASYALASVALALVLGATGILNMAHGALLALGGYLAYGAATQLGWHWAPSLLGTLAGGALAGALLYACVVAPMSRVGPAQFPTAVLIATIGLGIAGEQALVLAYGGIALRQPLALGGGWTVGPVTLMHQDLAVIVTALAALLLLGHFLQHTDAGRAMRAVEQDREAAALQGIPVARVHLQVFALAGAIATLCGVMISGTTQISPGFGNEPMFKAFIVCVLAGLGRLQGVALVALVLGLVEAAVQYRFGAHWGFPALLALVMATLVWRPGGLFAAPEVRRV